MRGNILLKTFHPLQSSAPEDKKASVTWSILGVFATSAVVTFLGSNLFSGFPTEITTHNLRPIPATKTQPSVRTPSTSPAALGPQTIPSNVPEYSSPPSGALSSDKWDKPVPVQSGRASVQSERRLPAVSLPRVDEHLSSRPAIAIQPELVASGNAQQLHPPPVFQSSPDQTKQETDAQRLLNEVANQQQAHYLAIPREFTAGVPTQPNPSAALSDVPSRDATAVIAALNRYSNAWNSKALHNITALRPGLDRRAVKEELSSSRYIVMRIHPTAAPKIEGDRATVQCLHQVDQVFDDGSVKQNPGIRMTYTLVKRDGNWLIAESH